MCVDSAVSDQRLIGLLLLFLTEPINVTLDGQELLQTSFQPTKLMSTYVLALSVCDFAFRETRLADNTLVITHMHFKHQGAYSVDLVFIY